MIKQYKCDFDEPDEYELDDIEKQLLHSKIATRALALLLSVCLIFLILVVFQTSNEVRDMAEYLARPTTTRAPNDADAIKAIQNRMDLVNQKMDVVIGYVRPVGK